MKSVRKEHLVQVAKDLFYHHGFHAVGIDRILAESGVSKTTLYKHFHSKDALVIATLGAWADHLKKRLERILEERGKMPITRIESMFILLARMSREKGFNGDVFLNAMAEYNSKNHEVRKVAQDYKEKMWAWVFDAVRETKVADVRSVARQLVMLYEGTVTAVQVSREPSAVDFARQQVRNIIVSSKKAVS